ncbi:hypothetical protein RYX36_026158, partial [Vicia faba]
HVHLKRCDMNIKAQLCATLLLYNIKPRSHVLTILIDLDCLFYYMIKGWNIDVAQVISNEIRKIAISGHSHGMKACVDIPSVATKRISSIVNDDYVPKLA